VSEPKPEESIAASDDKPDEAAAASDTTAVSLMLEGREMTIVSFTAMGTYRVNGTINEAHLVERVQTWVPNPVLGDMLYANARARNAAPRLALHAALLGFTHPQTGKAMRFEAPLADDLEQLRRFLIRGPHRD